MSLSILDYDAKIECGNKSGNSYQLSRCMVNDSDLPLIASKWLFLCLNMFEVITERIE